MEMKEYSAFPKDPALLESHYQIVLYHIQDIHWGCYSSSEVESVYSVAYHPNWLGNTLMECNQIKFIFSI